MGKRKKTKAEKLLKKLQDRPQNDYASWMEHTAIIRSWVNGGGVPTEGLIEQMEYWTAWLKDRRVDVSIRDYFDNLNKKVRAGEVKLEKSGAYMGFDEK